MGIVKVSDEKEKGVKTAEVELPADQYDINCQYDAALFALDDRPSKMEVGLYKVLWWLFTDKKRHIHLGKQDYINQGWLSTSI